MVCHHEACIAESQFESRHMVARARPCVTDLRVLHETRKRNPSHNLKL